MSRTQQTTKSSEVATKILLRWSQTAERKRSSFYSTEAIDLPSEKNRKEDRIRPIGIPCGINGSSYLPRLTDPVTILEPYYPSDEFSEQRKARRSTDFKSLKL